MTSKASRFAAATALCASIACAAAEPAPAPVETLVFVRHGEKPKPGLGLLTCKGLNRALKLPQFFADNFAKPDYIFAPDPSVKVTEIHGDGQRYDYVRCWMRATTARPSSWPGSTSTS
jgi:hypothetical protein